MVRWSVGIDYFPFFLADFFAADFLSAVFLAEVFFAALAAFLAGAFLAAFFAAGAAAFVVFFAATFLVVRDGRSAIRSSAIGSSDCPSAPDSINTTSDQRM